MGFFEQFKSQQRAEDILDAKTPADMTREELASVEKKMKSQKITTAVFIGVLLGVAVWSATHGGLIMPIILMFFAFLIGYRNNQRMKSIQEEMSRKGDAE